MSFCPYCGKPIRDGAKFCGKCGRELVEDASGAGDGMPASPQPSQGASTALSSRSPKSYLPFIVTALVAFVAAAAFVALFLRGGGGSEPSPSSSASGDSKKSTSALVESTGSNASQNASALSEQAGKTSQDAASDASGSQKAITYTWSREVPDGFEAGTGAATVDIVYPVFSTTLDDKTVVDAINADVREQLEPAYRLAANGTSANHVYFCPEVTLLNDKYLSVHYYHWYDASSMGAQDIAGFGGLYDLTDGSKLESPAAMLGMSEDDMLSLTDQAIDDSGIRQQCVYQGSFAEMRDQRKADYVVLSDGVYAFLMGIPNTDMAPKPTLMTFHLVGVCALDGSAGDVRGRIINLATEDVLEQYRNLDRTEVAEDAGSADDAPADASPSADSDDYAQTRSDYEAAGKRTFEGTVRIMGGEEAVEMAGMDINANGEYGADLERRTTYAFLMLDEDTTIENVNQAGDRIEVTTNRLLLGESHGDSSAYTPGSVGPAEDFFEYDGQRICIACTDVSKTSGVDLIRTPLALDAEVIYTGL